MCRHMKCWINLPKAYLMENFDIDISDYDVIKGYRADDSYFSFAEDFLSNAISVSHLSRAMRLGKLGIQYVLVSQKAFDALHFVQADPVENSVYYPLHIDRSPEFWVGFVWRIINGTPIEHFKKLLRHFITFGCFYICSSDFNGFLSL